MFPRTARACVRVVCVCVCGPCFAAIVLLFGIELDEDELLWLAGEKKEGRRDRGEGSTGEGESEGDFFSPKTTDATSLSKKRGGVAQIAC